MMRFWRILMLSNHFGSSISLISLIIISLSMLANGIEEAEGEENQLNELHRQQLRQKLTLLLGDKLNYPDYCWFGGLENRILLEYPQLENLIKLHHEKLHQEANYLRAVELHKEIFMNIYQIELQRNVELAKASNGNKQATNGQADRSLASPGTGTGAGAGAGQKVEQSIDTAEHRAAYKLFDLWANTPGDFERKQNDYSNYLEPYLIQAHIEFWSYCLDERSDCHAVLNQLMVLARERELGPIELLQISLNMIMLMNSHKADLVLERLIERKVIKLDNESNHQIDDKLYEQKLANLVKLIEIDEDFNEATFNYMFTQNDEIHKIIDSKMEFYLADRISKFELQLEKEFEQ